MKGSSVKERLSRHAKDLRGQLVSVYYAIRDPRVKALPKIVIGLCIAYALSLDRLRSLPYDPEADVFKA